MTTAVPFELRIARQKGYATVEEYRAARARAYDQEMARRAAERERAAAARRAARVLREVEPFTVVAGADVYLRTSDGRVRAATPPVRRAKLLPGHMIGGRVGLATVAELGPSRWVVRVIDPDARPVAALELFHRWEVDYALDAMGCAVEGAREFCRAYNPLPAGDAGCAGEVAP